MAEEAFALSPINARPNVPGEADYEAIREAFMETARGRWFLAEYTKRNRNADTNLLLDAVSRLESNLTAQKQQPQGLSLTSALGAIRSAVRQAKATAIEVLPRETGDGVQTAARNGARIISEIAATLRACGADTRICDLLDTQVTAIQAGHDALPPNGRAAVLASYDALMERIEALADGNPLPSAKAEAPAAEQAAEPHEASVTPLFKAPANEPAVELPPEMEQAPEPEIATALVEEAAPETSPDLAEAEDLAVLDAIAMEMGAIDPDEPDSDELFAPASEAVGETVHAAPSAPVDQAPLPQPHVTDSMTLAEIAASALAPEPPQAAAQTAAPSLGAALIASGVIAHPATPASDPLAPIRRMTQAEKIAFFS